MFQRPEPAPIRGVELQRDFAVRGPCPERRPAFLPLGARLLLRRHYDISGGGLCIIYTYITIHLVVSCVSF